MIRVLDLFSGIGGFSLGLKRAGGFRTVCYVEIEAYCQEVLKARMQDGSLDMAPIWDDVTKFDGNPWRGQVDIITGGFPCQDISGAGKKVGIKGERSGLWREYARIICEIQPRYILVENVAALLVRGIDVVLGELAEIGYDAEWDCIPASALGAPHQRERIWIVAYPKSQPQRPGLRQDEQAGSGRGRSRDGGVQEGEVSNSNSVGRLYSRKGQGSIRFLGGTDSPRGSWPPEPSVGRVAYGVSSGVDRLHALGNSVVPQVVEWIGGRIREALIGQKENQK